jgi:hypothetical protein
LDSSEDGNNDNSNLDNSSEMSINIINLSNTNVEASIDTNIKTDSSDTDNDINFDAEMNSSELDNNFRMVSEMNDKDDDIVGLNSEQLELLG